MKRRDFLKAGTVAAGAAAVTAASNFAKPAIAQDRVEMNIVSTWPRDFPGLGTGAQRFAQRVSDLSEGRIQVEYFAAGERVGAFDAFDEVASGNAQAYHGADYYWKGRHPGWAYFTAVPFGLTYTEMNAWIRFAGGQELWDELGAEFGIKGLMCGSTGVQMGGWFNREINSIDDFKGLKMRIPGLGGKVISKAGGSAVLSAGGEIYTNLERGVIDATEWIGPFHDKLMGFHKAAKYYYYPGWHEPGGMLELIVNKSAFQSLPPDLQEIVRTAAARSNLWILSEFEAQNHAALKELVDEHGVQLRQFPDDVIATLRQYTDEVIAELAASDPMSKKVYDAYSAFRGNVTGWSALSEKMYYSGISS